VIPALEKSSECQGFLADLHSYLEHYGRQLNSIFALSEPSWMEDPKVVIENLQAYITRPDSRLEAEQAAMVAEREKAIAEARAKLAGIPNPSSRNSRLCSRRPRPPRSFTKSTTTGLTSVCFTTCVRSSWKLVGAWLRMAY
jgi:hypothetical protein